MCTFQIKFCNNFNGSETQLRSLQNCLLLYVLLSKKRKQTTDKQPFHRLQLAASTFQCNAQCHGKQLACRMPRSVFILTSHYVPTLNYD